MKLDRLLQSPFTMAKELHSKIEREIAHAQAGRPAKIIAKMNALVEPEMIRALYRASQAGVRVDLIVRGMCSLRPGVKGLSENIRSEEHTSELQSLMRISYAVFCLKK